jgi:hypothetical protein
LIPQSLCTEFQISLRIDPKKEVQLLLHNPICSMSN